MKTYLSRLVARAQPSAAPIARAASNSPGGVEDPFTQTAPLAPPPSAPLHTPQRTPTPAARTAQRHAPAAEPAANRSVRETTSHSPSEAPPMPRSEIKIVPPKSAPPTPSSLSSVQPPAQENPVPRAPVSSPSPAQPAKSVLTPRADATTPGASPLFHDKTDPFAQTAAADTPSSPAGKLSPPVATPVPASSPVAGNEEARLQETADLFMARLSRRAEALLTPAPAPRAAEHNVIAPPVSVAPRLQPAARAMPAPRPSARFGLGQL